MAVPSDVALHYLKNSLSAGRLAHAYLITGARGAGKEAFARQFLDLAGAVDPAAGEPGRLIGCEGDRITIIRPGKKSRSVTVDAIRGLERRLQFAAGASLLKVGVVVDAERMNESAQNAFLKTLEEPPPGVHILLLTAHPEQLLTTILSRCIQVPLMPGAKAAPEGAEAKLLAALGAYASAGGANALGALGFGTLITSILKEAKGAIEGRHDSTFKEERKRYGQTTDGKWLDGREDHHKAEAAGEYLDCRRNLVGIIYSWLGDALRQSQGVPAEALDLPSEAAATAAFAQTQSRQDLLSRVEAAEDLVQNVQTNASEALVLEVGLMKALG